MIIWIRPAQRGIAAIGMVVVLVTAQLIIVGAVLSGSRDLDMTVQRLDSARAFYAAEAGENMAIREVMGKTDNDGDGGVGSISNDGVPNNDPLLITARVSVSTAASGGQTTLTSKARSGLARRQASAITTGGGGTGASIMVCFNRSGRAQPRYAIYSAGSWGPNLAMPSIGREPTFVMLHSAPTRNETVFCAEDYDFDVNVVLFNGTSWGPVTEVCSDTNEENDRAMDAAYELVSGDAMVVHWKYAVGKIGYRTWNGTTLSAESLLTLPGYTQESDYLTLYPRPGTDEIVLLAEDGDTPTCRLSACIWNGNSWGSWTTISTVVSSDDEECYSMAFESQSGDGLLVYADTGQSQPRYRTLSGSTWSAQSLMPTIGATPIWVRLAADQTGNTILFASLDDQRDVNVNVWNGSAWGSNLEVETNTADYDRRQADLAFESGTNRALLVYGESGINQPRYRTWNGSVWSAELSGTSIGRPSKIVHVVTGNSPGEAFIAISDDQRDLHLLRWIGSAWSTDTIIETDLGGTADGEPFMLAIPPIGAKRRVVGWFEEAPN